MVFSTLLFIFAFLPLFLAAYFLTPNRYKNYTVFVSSLLFYAWGAPRFVFVLLITTYLDFLISHQMVAPGISASSRKRWLTLAVVLNLGLLAYFKYANFFIEQVNTALSYVGANSIAWTQIVLPIGVSFFIFQILGYLVDVYRGEIEPTKKFGTLLLFIVLFPHLIAGPIIRFRDIALQIENRSHTLDRVFSGFCRFILGLSRKVLLADPLAEIADKIFAMPGSEVTPGYAWLGIICYAFQIYHDFAGYSDMAIGLARIIGFDFQENFNSPYAAQTITDFWRRWHISLSSFMREFLYIPLGGNRGSRWKMYRNLWLVFILSGLWHGANWTFILWGCFHGFFLIIDRVFWLPTSARLPRLVNQILTFVIVLFGWVLFRAESVSQAGVFSLNMLGLGNTNSFPLLYAELVPNRTSFILVLSMLLALLSGSLHLESWRQRLVATMPDALKTAGIALSALLLFLLSVMALTNSSFHPFIYFRF